MNDATGADYIKQPHGAPAFAGVAPQGQLAATADLLLVPGGRSLPAALDRHTGQLRYFTFGNKGRGARSSLPTSRESSSTRGPRHDRLNLADGSDGKFQINEPVLAAGVTYAANAPGRKGWPTCRRRPSRLSPPTNGSSGSSRPTAAAT